MFKLEDIIIRQDKLNEEDINKLLDHANLGISLGLTESNVKFILNDLYFNDYSIDYFNNTIKFLSDITKDIKDDKEDIVNYLFPLIMITESRNHPFKMNFKHLPETPKTNIANILPIPIQMAMPFKIPDHPIINNIPKSSEKEFVSSIHKVNYYGSNIIDRDKNIDKMWYELSQERKDIVTDFIKFMYKYHKYNNKVLLHKNVPYENLKISSLENVILYLYAPDYTFYGEVIGPQHRIIPNKSKEIFFADVIGKDIGYSNFFIIDKYLSSFEKNCTDIQSTNILGILFNNIINSYNHESFYKYIENEDLISSFEGFSEILMTRSRDDRFYEIVNTMARRIDISFYKEGLEILNKIKNNPNIKQKYYPYINKLLNSKNLNTALRLNTGNSRIEKTIKLLEYNDVKSLEEIKECNRLKIPNYLPIVKIGEGGTRNVYKVIHKQREHTLALKLDKKLEEITKDRAITVLSKKPNGELANRERRALMELTHENLARMWDFGVHKNRDYIVEEYVEGNNLEEYIKKYGVLGEEQFILIFTQVFRGIKYLHDKKYVHRDIKPNNIILSKNLNIVKLTDLQNAVRIENSGSYIGSSYGSLKTMAPEVILNNKFSFDSDIYSLGICIYYALTGKYPFDYGNNNEDINYIKNKLLENNYNINLRNIKNDIFSSRILQTELEEIGSLSTLGQFLSNPEILSGTLIFSDDMEIRSKNFEYSLITIDRLYPIIRRDYDNKIILQNKNSKNSIV